MEELRSAGPAISPAVSDAEFAELEEQLDKGPSVHGFEDERWTLARVQTVIRRRMRGSLSVATVWRLLKRHASPSPARPSGHRPHPEILSRLTTGLFEWGRRRW
ncbi:winged helix-turn-helix domain-containing protein [Streptomyces sp. NPDC049949]|uniref:helix-turn-helix domain-containing protein n=1 Tax=Streptomyces sp. NPDC049949 TaxID=3154627 RepID=UPI0034301EAF